MQEIPHLLNRTWSSSQVEYHGCLTVAVQEVVNFLVNDNKNTLENSPTGTLLEEEKPAGFKSKKKSSNNDNVNFLVKDLEFSPNFNPWRLDRELSELRDKMHARKKLLELR